MHPISGSSVCLPLSSTCFACCHLPVCCVCRIRLSNRLGEGETWLIAFDGNCVYLLQRETVLLSVVQCTAGQL